MSRVHEQLPSGPPRRRYSLLLLIVPVVGYLLTPVVANTVEPRIFGLPFIVTYTIIVAILTWLCVWMAARGDHFYRADRPEHIPADIAFGEDYAIDGPATDASTTEEAGK